MDWSACSPDLNPIRHGLTGVFDALNILQGWLVTSGQPFVEEWVNIPQMTLID